MRERVTNLSYKLVRDKIPELIKEAGKECAYKNISLGDELSAALADKLVEEALELREAILKIDNNSIIEEMADLAEVLECLKGQCVINDFDVVEKICEKRRKRGSFKEGVYLEKVV